MKKYVLLLALLATSSVFANDVQVDGYMRRDGTYVQPHMRSAPDNNPYNNYSAQGNTNPYTGQQGNVNPTYEQPSQPTYGNNRGQSGICAYGQRC